MNINYAIPDELHRKLKIRAAAEGVTLKAEIINLLQRGLIAAEADAGSWRAAIEDTTKGAR